VSLGTFSGLEVGCLFIEANVYSSIGTQSLFIAFKFCKLAKLVVA